MAEVSIERIRQAEVLADEKIRQAHQEAVQIKDSAAVSAQRLLRQSEDDAVASAAEKIAALQQKNENALIMAAKDLEESLNSLAAKALERQQQAAAKVIGSIV